MDLDLILTELGEFGKYQVRLYALLFFPFVFSGMTAMSYVFTAGDVEYRCKIPECEANITSYDEPWLSNAFPFKDGKLESQCKRYKVIDTNYHGNCSENIFIHEKIEGCHSFVFKNNENNIMKEFDLLCEENYWKKTLVGTLSNIGDFIGMFVAGTFSDRFGRKTMIITGVICASIIGTLRSFTSDYIQFVICEVANGIAIGGVYSGLFILGIESTGPKKRALGGIILCSFYPVGEVFLGVIVWLVSDWRIYLRIIHIPALIVILYCWIIPESIRWLLSRGKREKLLKTLENISFLNKRPMNENIRKSVEKIDNIGSMETEASENNSTKGNSKNPVRQVIKSKIMLMRVSACSFCWIVNAFVSYGLSLSSTFLIGGNKYFNFILVSFIQIPGYIIAWLVIDVLGRKWTFAGSLLVSGIACSMFHFVVSEIWRQVLFLVGKCAITVSFAVVYVHASEFFPTNLRNSLLCFCSTMGRFGSMLAPQTPLLSPYVDPVLLFGLASFVSAIVALHFPETLNCKLPDTVEEAEELGKGSKKTKEQENNH